MRNLVRKTTSLFFFSSVALVAAWFAPGCIGDEAQPGGGGTDAGSDVVAAANFSLALSPTALTLYPGATASLTLTVTRAATFTDAINIALSGLPANVGVDHPTLTIDAGSTVGTIVFSAAANATIGETGTVTITATGGGVNVPQTLPVSIAGVPGSFDTSFGSSGLRTAQKAAGIDATAFSAAFTPDGKILTVGQDSDGSSSSALIARFDNAGNVDTTFAVTGFFPRAIGNGTNNEASDVTMYANGNALVVGETVVSGQAKFGQAELLPNANPVPGFGDITGDVTTVVSSQNDRIFGVAPTDAGYYAVTGFSGLNALDAAPPQLTVAEYADDGGLLTSFSSSGLAIYPVLRSGYSVAFASNGDILIGGITSDSYPMVTALLPSSVEDSTFGSNATAKVPTALPALYNADYQKQLAPVVRMTIQPDNKILVTSGENSITRFTSIGAYDTFGPSQGTAVLTSDDHVYASALEANGTIVAVGSHFDTGTSTTTTAVWELNADGTLNTAFGTGGMVTINFPATFGSEAHAVLIAPDGRILVVGFAYVQNDGGAFNTRAIAMARLWP